MLVIIGLQTACGRLGLSGQAVVRPVVGEKDKEPDNVMEEDVQDQKSNIKDAIKAHVKVCLFTIRTHEPCQHSF